MTSEWVVVWDRKQKHFHAVMSGEAVAMAVLTAFRNQTPERYIVALAPNAEQAESYAQTLNQQARSRA